MIHIRLQLTGWSWPLVCFRFIVSCNLVDSVYLLPNKSWVTWMILSSISTPISTHLQRSITTWQVLSLVCNLDFSERFGLIHWHYGTEQKFILIKRIHKIMVMTKQMAWKRRRKTTHAKLSTCHIENEHYFLFTIIMNLLNSNSNAYIGCESYTYTYAYTYHEFTITSKIVYNQLHTNTRKFIQLTSINYSQHSRTVKYKLQSALPNSKV